MKNLFAVLSIVSLFLIAGCSTPPPADETRASGEKPPASTAAPAAPAAAKGIKSDVSREMKTPIEGLVLVKIDSGEFTMGSDLWSTDEKPAHKVKITKAFWIGKTEVTQSQYEKITGRNPSLYAAANSPVEQLSWEDAVAFCRKLTEMGTKSGQVPEGYAYRLPTEAEWEYACKAGTIGDYAGNIDDLAWTGGNSRNSTQDVATKSPNSWGIYDMHGNVWEWCLDSCDFGDSGVKTDTFFDGVSDPLCTKGNFRLLKGGSWSFDKKFSRSASRYADKPDFAAADIGFRIVLGPIKP